MDGQTINTVMSMRSIITLICLVIISQNTCYASTPSKPTVEENVIITPIWPNIEAAVKSYYSEYISGDVSVAPYDAKIIAVDDKSKSEVWARVHKYMVTIDVMPFIGAHNYLGKDRVVIGVDIGNATKVYDFKHLESYEINHPYQKKRFIKPLP